VKNSSEAGWDNDFVCDIDTEDGMLKVMLLNLVPPETSAIDPDYIRGHSLYRILTVGESVTLVFQLVFPIEEDIIFTACRGDSYVEHDGMHISLPQSLQVKQLSHLEIDFGYYKMSDVANIPKVNLTRGTKKNRSIEANEIWLEHSLVLSVPEHRISISLGGDEVRELAKKTPQTVSKGNGGGKVSCYNLTYHAEDLPEGEYSTREIMKRKGWIKDKVSLLS